MFQCGIDFETTMELIRLEADVWRIPKQWNERMLGRSSEKGKYFDGEHLTLFNEAEMVAEPSVPEPENGADASARCYIIIESGNLNDLILFNHKIIDKISILMYNVNGDEKWG